MIKTPCVILAGGKSSRMGVDKSKLKFGGFGSLCEYQVSRLKPLFKSVHVSSKEDKFDFDVDLILDSEDIFSPMVALKKILFYFENTPVFILSVDAPFVGENEIKRLYEYTKTSDIVIPKTSSYTHQLCGFYRSNLAFTCKKLLSQDIHKIRALFEHAKVKCVEFEDEKAFMNLNYFDEYEKALKFH